jgi:hypothetical protein
MKNSAKPAAKKGRTTGFFLFMKEHRTEVVKQNTGMKLGETAKMLG